MTFTVAIGAGHGGYVSLNPKVYATPGKRTPDGEPEWTFNDKIVDAAIKHLTFNGIKTIRLDDPTGKTDVPLATRKAKGDKADIYVSMHNNALNSVYGNHGGTETFYFEGSEKSKKLATLIHKEAVKVIGATDRGIKRGNHLYEIHKVIPPSCLLESLFMDGIEDIKKLRNDSLLAEIGKGVAKGICAYFGLEFKEYVAPAPKPAESTSKPAPSSSGELYKVIVNGKQIGAFKDPLKSIQEQLAKHPNEIIIKKA